MILQAHLQVRFELDRSRIPVDFLCSPDTGFQTVNDLVTNGKITDIDYLSAMSVAENGDPLGRSAQLYHPLLLV